MRRAIAALLFASMLPACDGDPPPPPPPPPPRRDAGGIDAGTFDSGVDRDGGMMDAGRMDAGPRTDGGTGIDTGIIFVDSGPGSDSGPRDSGAIDYCAMVPAGTPCPCSAGEICLDNGCGAMRCYPAGNPCSGASDCHASSSCVGGHCAGPSPGMCNDSRDCPAGYSCDSNTCVDRRVACTDVDGCPQGFACDLSLAEGAPYCFRVSQPCAAATGCLFGAQCRDVAGTGQSICHYSSGPSCQLNGDCPVIGEVCGVDPIRLDAACQAYGPCASASDCMSGWTCTDLWGDGVTECVPPGGSCTQQSDCPAGQVCAIPFAGGPPSCI